VAAELSKMGETKRLNIVAGLKQDVDIEVNLSAAYECDGGPPKSTGYHVARCPKFTSPTLATKNTRISSIRRHAGAPSRPHRRHSLLKLLLEVVLITTGVYLGLAGESSCPSHRSHGRGP